MRSHVRRFFILLPCLFVIASALEASASTITQNVSWTIDRPGTDVKYRIVAYGDSIFAGYKGSVLEVAIYAAPTVDGDYAQADWNADVETFRRAKSGATAKQIYEDKIVDDVKFMQAANTRVVAFEMCGNDALQARNDFKTQDGTCDYGKLDDALADCTTYQELAMQFINANAAAGTKRKIIMNLYYAGYDDDDQPADCTNSPGGEHPNRQDVFLQYLAHINWRACHFAQMNGFECEDAFAQFMGSDFDSNADGRRDSRALRYRRGESESGYVTRITTTLRPTIRDPNAHFVTATRSFDYIQSDDTHPTFSGGDTSLGIFSNTAKGSSAPRYPDEQYADGKVPIWRKFGHERIGTGLSVFNPDTP
ncbi:MAG TPA: SGNH/GDSL hydrolase family protein [Candidatus Limnocylindrales bacterium]|nr:SGNH/GDSL hydrolase family protein [Candidatus Limnocylindrales bacterium]